MDITQILQSFNAHKVCYVVIGAAAFPVHGYDRATQDIDLFINPTVENAKRAMAALEALGYDLQGLSIEKFLERKTLFRQYILNADIHPFVAGATFEEVWASRVYALYRDVPANFPSLDVIIAMKRAAGRPKDLEDLRYLEKIRAIKRARKKKRSQSTRRRPTKSVSDNSVKSIKGMLTSPKCRPVTIAEMKKAIRRRGSGK